MLHLLPSFFTISHEIYTKQVSFQKSETHEPSYFSLPSYFPFFLHPKLFVYMVACLSYWTQPSRGVLQNTSSEQSRKLLRKIL